MNSDKNLNVEYKSKSELNDLNLYSNMLKYITDIKITKYLKDNFYQPRNKQSANLIQQEINNTDDNDNNRFHLKLTVSIVLICLYVMFNDIFVRTDFTYELKCFDDKLFTLTEGISGVFKSNNLLLDGYLIMAGFLMDCAFLMGVYYFIKHFHTFRMLISLGLLYSIRGQIQNAYMMDHPEGMLFRDPGVISIAVPYHKTNDYFFSGHVSLPTLIAYEFYKHGMFMQAGFCFFVTFFEFIMMLILRGHYSIDLYAGLFFAFYFCRISDKITPYIDFACYGCDISIESKSQNSNGKLTKEEKSISNKSNNFSAKKNSKTLKGKKFSNRKDILRSKGNNSHEYENGYFPSTYG